MFDQKKSYKLQATSHKLSRGFSLVELMVYVGIFAMVSIFLSNIFIITIRVQNKESSTNAVTRQLNFVLSTVQRLVRSSSAIECVDLTSGICNANTVGSYLKLRFENSANDPTCIYISGDTIKLAEGPDLSNKNLCSTDPSKISDLTDPVKVKNVTLQFTKTEVPNAHALLQIDSSMTYNSTAPGLAITRSVSSAIGRVSAATFDSSILPNVVSPNSFNIGESAYRWQDGFFSGDLDVAGTVTAKGGTLTVWRCTGGTTGALALGTLVAAGAQTACATSGGTGVDTGLRVQ